MITPNPDITYHYYAPSKTSELDIAWRLIAIPEHPEHPENRTLLFVHGAWSYAVAKYSWELAEKRVVEEIWNRVEIPSPAMAATRNWPDQYRYFIHTKSGFVNGALMIAIGTEDNVAFPNTHLLDKTGVWRKITPGFSLSQADVFVRDCYWKEVKSPAAGAAVPLSKKVLKFPDRYIGVEKYRGFHLKTFALIDLVCIDIDMGMARFLKEILGHRCGSDHLIPTNHLYHQLEERSQLLPKKRRHK